MRKSFFNQDSKLLWQFQYFFTMNTAQFSNRNRNRNLGVFAYDMQLVVQRWPVTNEGISLNCSLIWIKTIVTANKSHRRLQEPSKGMRGNVFRSKLEHSNGEQMYRWCASKLGYKSIVRPERHVNSKILQNNMICHLKKLQSSWALHGIDMNENCRTVFSLSERWKRHFHKHLSNPTPGDKDNSNICSFEWQEHAFSLH